MFTQSGRDALECRRQRVKCLRAAVTGQYLRVCAVFGEVSEHCRVSVRVCAQRSAFRVQWSAFRAQGMLSIRQSHLLERI